MRRNRPLCECWLRRASLAVQSKYKPLSIDIGKRASLICSSVSCIRYRIGDFKLPVDQERPSKSASKKSENKPQREKPLRQPSSGVLRRLGLVRENEFHQEVRRLSDNLDALRAENEALAADKTTLQTTETALRAEIAALLKEARALERRLDDTHTLEASLSKIERALDEHKGSVQSSIDEFRTRLQKTTSITKSLASESAARSSVDPVFMENSLAREAALHEALRDSDRRAAQQINALRAALDSAQSQFAMNNAIAATSAIAAEIALLTGDETVSDCVSVLQKGLKQGAFSLASVSIEEMLTLAQPKGARVAIVGEPTSTAQLRTQLDGAAALRPKSIEEAQEIDLLPPRGFDVVIGLSPLTLRDDPIGAIKRLTECVAPGGRLVLLPDPNGKVPPTREAIGFGPDKIVALLRDWDKTFLRLAGAGRPLGVDIHEPASAMRFFAGIGNGALALQTHAVFTAPGSSKDHTSVNEELQEVAPTSESRDGMSSQFVSGSKQPSWVFVLPKGARGWILHGIAKEIARRTDGNYLVADYSDALPEADRYFFMHYLNYIEQCRRQPELRDRPCYVWYTHPRGEGVKVEDVAKALNGATHVFPTCGLWRDHLVSAGLAAERATLVIGGADQHLFKPKTRRGDGAVGLSSMYYPRKQPDLVLDVVREMPHRQFLLLGRGWEEYSRFDALMTCDNFQYVTASYEEYPSLYQKMDVFLSTSTLEGGPIPLIEAMMSNLCPAASRTGFAPDIIEHGRNGFIFDTDAEAGEVVQLIDAAFNLEADIRDNAMPYSWDNFAERVIETCLASEARVDASV